jgi:hypothetical protein
MTGVWIETPTTNEKKSTKSYSYMMLISEPTL